MIAEQEIDLGVLNPEGIDNCRHSMPQEDAIRVGKRVVLALMRGSEEIALEAVRDAWRDHMQNLELPVGPALLDEPLARVLDDVRVLNTLEEELEIITIGDFLRETAGTFPRVPNIGHLTIAQLNNLAVTMRARAQGAEQKVAHTPELRRVAAGRMQLSFASAPDPAMLAIVRD